MTFRLLFSPSTLCFIRHEEGVYYYVRLIGSSKNANKGEIYNVYGGVDLSDVSIEVVVSVLLAHPSLHDHWPVCEYEPSGRTSL